MGHWLASGKEPALSKINNPCSCEFLSAPDQKIITKKLGIQVKIGSMHNKESAQLSQRNVKTLRFLLPAEFQHYYISEDGISYE